MNITEQVSNIIDNLNLETNANKASVARFINSDLSHFELYTAEELVQAVIDEVELLSVKPSTLKLYATVRKATTLAEQLH